LDQDLLLQRLRLEASLPGRVQDGFQAVPRLLLPWAFPRDSRGHRRDFQDFLRCCPCVLKPIANGHGPLTTLPATHDASRGWGSASETRSASRRCDGAPRTYLGRRLVLGGRRHQGRQPQVQAVGRATSRRRAGGTNVLGTARPRQWHRNRPVVRWVERVRP
jgi:hypothetical protein